MEQTCEAVAIGAAPGSRDDPQRCELTVLMPCLDEAETLATCIEDTGLPCPERYFGRGSDADNGSTDGYRQSRRRTAPA